MSEQQYDKMTVIELRRVAKERGVKLGANISKQEIINKLSAADGQNAAPAAPVMAEPAPQQISLDAPVRPIRKASIITDDEPQYDDDDIPVLTRNSSLAAPRPAPVRPLATTPASQPRPAAPVQSTISSKAPAFTMEGSRAWHNPRTQSGSPGSNYQPQPRTQWTTRPAAPAPAPTARVQAPRQDMPRTPVRTPYAPPARFGPEQTYVEQEHNTEYQPAYEPPQPEPRYNTDYAPRNNDYVPPRQEPQPFYHKELGTSNPAVPEMLATGECGDATGVLELHPDGYGFLRVDNFLPGKRDVYVSNAQIRRFSLRSGDTIVGKTRPQREGDKYSALLYITQINGRPADDPAQATPFEDLTPIYPQKRMHLTGKEKGDPALRLIDLIAPIGFGQRTTVVASPKVGKTTLLKKMASAIKRLHPAAHLMVVLVDERPEEVTDIKEFLQCDVYYSTFDEPAENHIRVCELTLERAMRMVEEKQDVVILLDSITRLARAYNSAAPQNARILPGGLAASAVHKPKRFMGAARNVRQGGSLTIIATALVETGNRIDEAVFEEMKGTSNMELYLERIPSEKRLFPAINILKSSTRHDEILLSEKERSTAARIRDMLAGADPNAAIEQLVSMLEKTTNNADLIERFDSWMQMLSM